MAATEIDISSAIELLATETDAGVTERERERTFRLDQLCASSPGEFGVWDEVTVRNLGVARESG